MSFNCYLERYHINYNPCDKFSISHFLNFFFRMPRLKNLTKWLFNLKIMSTPTLVSSLLFQVFLRPLEEIMHVSA